MPHPTDRFKFRYVWKHGDTGDLKIYRPTIEEIESGEISELRAATFGYKLIARDQFTGLTDREGVEVYENDVIEAPHDYGPGGFHIRRARVSFDPLAGYQWNYWNTDKLIVIGSIHENPDLLTQEQG